MGPAWAQGTPPGTRRGLSATLLYVFTCSVFLKSLLKRCPADHSLPIQFLAILKQSLYSLQLNSFQSGYDLLGEWGRAGKPQR